MNSPTRTKHQLQKTPAIQVDPEVDDGAAGYSRKTLQIQYSIKDNLQPQLEMELALLCRNNL